MLQAAVAPKSGALAGDMSVTPGLGITFDDGSATVGHADFSNLKHRNLLAAALLQGSSVLFLCTCLLDGTRQHVQCIAPSLLLLLSCPVSSCHAFRLLS